MLKDNYFNRLKELPETIKQFVGLVIITVIIISTFGILNTFWGGGDELIKNNRKIVLHHGVFLTRNKYRNISFFQ